MNPKPKSPSSKTPEAGPAYLRRLGDEFMAPWGVFVMDHNICIYNLKLNAQKRMEEVNSAILAWAREKYEGR